MEILWATLLALRRSSSLGSLLGVSQAQGQWCAIDRLGGGADTLKLNTTLTKESTHSISSVGMVMSYSPKVSGRVMVARGATADSVGKSTAPGRNACIFYDY
jgi:hypothetical protein